MNFLRVYEAWELHTSHHVAGKGKYKTDGCRTGSYQISGGRFSTVTALFLRNVKRQNKKHRAEKPTIS